MRFVHTVLALLVSTGSVLAFAAQARAQSCNQYQPPLEGNWQLQLGNNSCAALTGVRVSVAVTQDIIVDSSTQGYNGFGMQLNANGPSSGLTSSQLYWQQFVLQADTQNLTSGESAGVNAFVQQWAWGTPAGGIYPTNPTFMGAPYTINNTFLTIPAGTTFNWALHVDPDYYVNSCTFTATDTSGTQYATVTEYIPSADRAPIYSITMDIVGYNAGSFTTFQSGAGTITYTGTTFSPSYNFPSCAQNTGTGENSNMVYGPLVAGSNGTFTQNFFASTVGVFRSGDCEPTSTYPSYDWAPGDYKAECPLGAPVYGVSRVPGQTWSEAIECGMPGQGAYSNSGNGCYNRVAEPYDNRGDTDNNWDWDPGSYKTECGANEYVAGVSQASGNGVVTSILCCPASVTHQFCDSQVFYNSDSAAYVPPDWDPGYYKGQCPAGQYVAGISTPAYSSVGIAGAAHAILCCSQ